MSSIAPAGGDGARPAGRTPPSGAARAAPMTFWAAAALVVLAAIGFRTKPRAAGDASRGAGTAARERGRGRHAETPSEIGPRGWKDILLRVKTEISEDRVLAIAAGIAFFALLAIFPAIGAFVSLYGLFADPASVGTHLEALSGVIPGGGMEVIREQLTRVASAGQGKLGLTFLIGLGLSLWSANGGTKALFDALNVVYEEREKRSFFKLTAISLLFTLGGIAFLLLAIAATVVIPLVLSFVGMGGVAETLLRVGRWPLLLLMIALGISLIYRFGPSREKAQWRWLTWGSAFAAVVWLAASMLFSWYAANFGSYNETYGSLGAVIGFSTWIWLSAIVVLVGAEINAEMEHQTTRDTTTGAPKSMGTRGATMADTVGPAHG